jgi:hypothetical protein
VKEEEERKLCRVGRVDGAEEEEEEEEGEEVVSTKADVIG